MKLPVGCINHIYELIFSVTHETYLKIVFYIATSFGPHLDPKVVII